jgi:hypothetical protein
MVGAKHRRETWYLMVST